MADNIAQETTQEAQQATAQDLSFSEKLQQAMFDGVKLQQQQTPPQQAQSAAPDTQTTQTSQPQQTKQDDEYETLDVSEWLKREFEIEDPEVLKQERQEYRKLKEQKPFEFKDEYSRKVFDSIKEGKDDDVYSYLHNKKQLERLEKLSISNTKEAAEIIKANLQFKHQNEGLTTEDIDFLYNKRYSMPSKPVQGVDQTDEEYAAVLDNWKESVAEKEREIIIEAKLARPELSKYKNELVFPDIQREIPQQQLSQEDLDKQSKFKESVLKSAGDSINNFKGFSANVKNKDVDYNLSYGLSNEEKGFITSKIQSFVENGFDANALFAENWVSKEGVLNTDKMIEDLSNLYFAQRASQKFANDSANQRLEMYLKEKKNINVTETIPNGTFEPEKKSQSQVLQERFWGS